MKTLATIAIVFMAAVFAGGCEQRTTSAAVPPGVSTGAAVAPVQQGTGSISGKVFLSGTAPTMRVIEQKVYARTTPLFEESVVANPDGTLKNVLVYLKDAPGQTTATGPAVLDQVDCQYVPHVMGVQTGQTLQVRSHDNTLHNVHVEGQANGSSNYGMIGPGEHDVKLNAAEIVHVGCDVHPWMGAYVGVFAHPYFAVTGADGSFEIKGVPAGRHTLAAWQERYGTLEAGAEVGPAAVAQVNFTYHAP